MNFSGESALAHSRHDDFGPAGWKALLFVGGTLLAFWSSHIAAWAVVTYAKQGGSHGNPVQVLQVLEDRWDAGQMLQCADDAGELG